MIVIHYHYLLAIVLLSQCRSYTNYLRCEPESHAHTQCSVSLAFTYTNNSSQSYSSPSRVQVMLEGTKLPTQLTVSIIRLWSYSPLHLQVISAKELSRGNISTIVTVTTCSRVKWPEGTTYSRARSPGSKLLRSTMSTGQVTTVGSLVRGTYLLRDRVTNIGSVWAVQHKYSSNVCK